MVARSRGYYGSDCSDPVRPAGSTQGLEECRYTTHNIDGKFWMVLLFDFSFSTDFDVTAIDDDLLSKYHNGEPAAVYRSTGETTE
jgi:hypothetical protein